MYHDVELVHYSPKSTAALSWTLPIQRTLTQANAVLPLPSDKKYLQFMFASFESPAHSTLVCALRKGFLSTLSRFTSTLFSKHKPNVTLLLRPWVTSTIVGRVLIPRPWRLLLFLSPYSATVSPPYDKFIDICNELDDEVLAMDCIVCNRLYTTADFDATDRFSVSSPGSKYAYQFVSCFNDNIHVEPMTSRTSASYIAAYDKTFFH